MKRCKLFILWALIALTAGLSMACKDFVSAFSDDTDITSFSFDGIVGEAVIDKSARTVAAVAEADIDLTKLVVRFGLSKGAVAKVGGTVQESGITANDFSKTVVYAVTSGSEEYTRDWKVTVTQENDPDDPDEPGEPEEPGGTEVEANILGITFTGIVGTAEIDADKRLVKATADGTVDITRLVVTLTLSKGATAEVGVTPQVNGVTANDFTNTVTYYITSGDRKHVNDWKISIFQNKAGECNLTREMVRDGGDFPKCTYTVRGTLQINSGKTLRFAPGTVILFEEDEWHAKGGFQGLSATLIAKGTEQEPIIFTSAKTNPAAGDWTTLQCKNVELEWCTVEYGGSVFEGREDFSFFMLGFSETGSMKHCTVRESVGTGINVAGTFTALEYVTVTNCGERADEDEYPMIVYESANTETMTHTNALQRLSVMGEGVVINTAKGVCMAGNVVSGNNILHKLNCPYLFTDWVGLYITNAGTTVTIEPGTQLVFGNKNGDSGLDVLSGGTLIAKGTAEDPIIITNTGELAWEGILFSQTCGAGCILEYCNINGNGVRVVGDTSEDSPIVTVKNCHITNSPSWGLYFYCTNGNCSHGGNTYENCLKGDFPKCN